MYRIVTSITSLKDHFAALGQTPDIYHPPACPYCKLAGLWGHGHYDRQADRGRDPGPSLNPVPICRYYCSGCHRTCSRLPLCIAPHRWYNWQVQQVVLLSLLNGFTVHACSRCHDICRRTVRRWRDWLHFYTEKFAFYLRSRFPELGRNGDGPSFWRAVMDGMSLGIAMAWLNQEMTVPCPEVTLT